MFLLPTPNAKNIRDEKMKIAYCKSREHSIEREISEELVDGYHTIHAGNIRHCLFCSKGEAIWFKSQLKRFGVYKKMPVDTML